MVERMHELDPTIDRPVRACKRAAQAQHRASRTSRAAIKQVAAGGRYVEGELAHALVLNPGPVIEPLEQLTPRDLEIIRLLARGRSLSEIADALGLGYKTIINACTQIETKLGVSRTTDLVRLALEARIC
jgi:DNA-binding NarL/FixJ family response regulator